VDVRQRKMKFVLGLLAALAALVPSATSTALAVPSSAAGLRADPCAATPSPFSNETACLTAACTWCACAAVPSSCTTYGAASKLPQSVFTCGNSSGPIAPGSPICETNADSGSCLAATGCNWCKSKAVPSKCFTFDESRRLPPGAFVCQL
jgi:hypothetical protein